VLVSGGWFTDSTVRADEPSFQRWQEYALTDRAGWGGRRRRLPVGL